MQHAGMLPWLASDGLVEKTCAQLGIHDWRAELTDTNWAFNNFNAQILLTALNLTAWRQLSRALPEPGAVAGYSVGELASFATAGVFDDNSALALAEARATAMDRCAVRNPGGLVAVSGLLLGEIEKLCISCGVEVAIENDSHAVVLGGPLEALDRAAEYARAMGAHITRLNVGLPSHTGWMKDASGEFERVLDSVSLSAPRIPLFCNAVDRIVSLNQIKRALSEQISRTVRWSNCMENIDSRRVKCVLEIGPGAALARMWNQRFPQVPARSVDEFSTAAAIIKWVERQCDD